MIYLCPYLFQIKQQHNLPHKNIRFVPFAKSNPLKQSIQIVFDSLEEFKSQKIKFITKLQQSTQSFSFIQISENPIHIENQCNYFLLNAFWSNSKNNFTKTAKISRVGSYTLTSQNFKKGHKFINHSNLQKEFFFNLVYVLSSVIYTGSTLVAELLSNIKPENRNFYKQKNSIKIIHYESIGKKQLPPVSTTAAQTKFNKQFIDSDLDEDFTIQMPRTSLQNFTTPMTPNNSQKPEMRKRSTLNHALDKLFSRSLSVQWPQTAITEKILRQISNFDEFSLSIEYLLFPSIEYFYKLYVEQSRILSVKEFHEHCLNQKIEKSIQKILLNYENSLELQFESLEQKSVDQIKQILSKLFDNVICEFYDEIGNQRYNMQQDEVLKNLILRLHEHQSQVFENICKGKKQKINYRISVHDDNCFVEKACPISSTKFDDLFGKNAVLDQQIGYGMYSQCVKQQLESIFNELVEESQKKKNHLQNSSGKLVSRKELFSNNAQHRLQILSSQKRNLQQSLLFQRRLQQNLIQYLKGLTTKPKKSDIQIIEESLQED